MRGVFVCVPILPLPTEEVTHTFPLCVYAALSIMQSRIEHRIEIAPAAKRSGGTIAASAAVDNTINVY